MPATDFDKGFQNFSGDGGWANWMRPINLRALSINPEYQNMSVHDILTNGGLGFGVAKVETTYNYDGVIYPSNGYSIIRTDMPEVELGKGFSDEYVPMSYTELLETFFGDITKLGGVPTRVVSLNNGKVGAMQFALPREWLIGDRAHKTFLNLFTSHDGTYGYKINECDICILCGNTFRFAHKDSSFSFTAKHTKNSGSRISEIRQLMLSAEKANTIYYETLQKAANMEANSKLVNEFLLAMFPDGEKNASGKVNQGPANRREMLSKAIGDTAAETNKSEISISDVFEGMLRYTADRTQKRNADEQLAYVLKSEENTLAYEWLNEKVNA